MSAERGVSMQRIPTAGRWAIYVALAAAFAVACAFLSDWQFDRNESRAAQLALVEANYDAAPVPYEQLVPRPGAADPAQEWHPVTLEGRYLPEGTLLARNRAHGGTSAFEVLVPFLLDSGRVVLVDRGWVPPGSEGPEPESVPAPPQGHSTVIARVRPGEPLPVSGRGAPDGQVPTIHLPTISELTAGLGGSTLETDSYLLMVSEDPAPAVQPHALPSPSEDPGPHLSYAIQWILFAIMGFVFIGYVIRTEVRHRRDEEAAGDDPAGEAPRRTQPRRRRRDRDAEDEDAILDAAAPGPR